MSIGRSLAATIAAAVLFAVATWLVPWWIVPVVAAALSLLAPGVFTPARLALAAALSWAALLAYGAVTGPLVRLAHALGATIHAPWPLLLLTSPLFAALLAWAGAKVTTRQQPAASSALRRDS